MVFSRLWIFFAGELLTAAPDTQDLLNRLHSSQEESTGVIAKTAAKINDILTPVKLTNRVSVLETLQSSIMRTPHHRHKSIAYPLR